MGFTPQIRIRVCRVGNLALALVAAFSLFLLPAGKLIRYLNDPLNGQPGVSRFAHDLFLNLTPKYERWAENRVRHSNADQLSTHNISGTEWPLFGSVFYLWAVENLQQSWEADPRLFPQAPALYAHDAVEAATALVLDDKHAGWVKKHWQDQYLTKEDVFYRALRIAAMTVRTHLTGQQDLLPQLRQEADALATELDRSPTGLLDDYPGECYPGDVLMAWLCIARADRVTGDNHSAMLSRAKRAFSGPLLDRHGLVPFCSWAPTGEKILDSQGCGNSYVSFCAPELWPAEAKAWYDAYEKNFWDVRWGIPGFREFARDVPDKDWYMDVDSGPVLSGLGVAANAFGVAAARKNGRFDHALALTGQLQIAAWPLPDGTLLLPRLLSNAADAPYLGEAAILFVLSTQPQAGLPIVTGGEIPAFVYGFWLLYLLLGVGTVMAAIRRFRLPVRIDADAADAAPATPESTAAPAEKVLRLSHRQAKLQFLLWLGFCFGGILVFLSGHVLPGTLLALLSLLFPRGKISRPDNA